MGAGAFHETVERQSGVGGHHQAFSHDLKSVCSGRFLASHEKVSSTSHRVGSTSRGQGWILLAASLPLQEYRELDRTLSGARCVTEHLTRPYRLGYSAREYRRAGDAVGRRDRYYGNRHQQPQSVDDSESLMTGDLSPSVISPGLPGDRQPSTHSMRIDQPCRRLGIPARDGSYLCPQATDDPPLGATSALTSMVMKHRASMRIASRQHPPLADRRGYMRDYLASFSLVVQRWGAGLVASSKVRHQVDYEHLLFAGQATMHGTLVGRLLLWLDNPIPLCLRNMRQDNYIFSRLAGCCWQIRRRTQ